MADSGAITDRRPAPPLPARPPNVFRLRPRQPQNKPPPKTPPGGSKSTNSREPQSAIYATRAVFRRGRVTSVAVDKGQVAGVAPGAREPRSPHNGR